MIKARKDRVTVHWGYTLIIMSRDQRTNGVRKAKVLTIPIILNTSQVITGDHVIEYTRKI